MSQAPTRIEQIRKIAEEHQWAEVEGHVVDATTATAFVRVHEALSDRNRERFDALPLSAAVDVMWKVIG